MNVYKLIFVFVLSVTFDLAVCQFYTSSFEIEKLLKLEETLLDSLNSYFKRQNKNGIAFEEPVSNFMKLANRKNRETNRDHDFDNPIATYHLLKRVVEQWNNLKTNLSCDASVDDCPLLTGEDVINVVTKRENLKWPTDVDLRLAAKAIFNVWNVFDLEIDDIVSGSLATVKEQPLSADDIYYIADVAKDSAMLYEAITWFEYLLARLDEFSSFKFKTSSLVRRLASTYIEYGSTAKAIEILEEYSKKVPADKGVARDLSYFRSGNQKLQTKSPVRFQDDDKSKKTRNRRVYEELCRNASQGNSIPQNLQCHNVPLFRFYGVAKIEILSKRPRIELIYDVLNDTETDELISYGEKSLGKLREALTYSAAQSSGQTYQSVPMCENNIEYPLMVNVSNRIERMTRFHIYPLGDVSSTECYNMVNEGLGGFQKPVVNYFNKGQELYPGAGNKVATVKLQLSDVTYGGSVVFPKLNLHTPVVKGSALIWWNLKSDGTPNPQSVHINCPVVVGSQWAAFKNILYGNQLFRRPCTRN